MGSSEPSLVPEWLKTNGHGSSGAAGASASNHSQSANSHSDASAIGNSARNRLCRTNTEIDNPRALLERSSSINSRSSSSNGSSKHPYSSFSRSHRDKDREKEKSGFGDLWERDGCQPLGKHLLRRNQSMMSRNQADSLPCRVALDPKNIEINSHLLRNGLVTCDKPVVTIPRVSFEKDFPSLGSDEKQVSNVVRVASPSLPIGSSASVGEGWSALAEVPVPVIGSNSGAQSIHQPLSTSVVSSTNSGGANAVSGASKTMSGTSNSSYGAQNTCGAFGSPSALNMAEALVQSSSVSRTDPQLSVETQRLEQMAIKKVRQLIPMTPATPKALNSSDKLKHKLSSRVGEIAGTTKVGQQLSSSSLNGVVQSPRSGPVTSDASKQSHGSKLSVLKSPWENSSSSTSKDAANLENGGACIRVANDLHVTPTASSAPARSTNISKASILERKAGFSSLSLASSVERRSLSSSAQSRSDFFNSVRKKTLMTTAVTSNTDSFRQSPSEEMPCELLKETISASPRGTQNGTSVGKDDSSSEVLNSLNRKNEKSSILCAIDTPPSEEEAVFLRSLGWEEFGEDGGLTEDEINGFYEVAKKVRPSMDPSAGCRQFFR